MVETDAGGAFVDEAIELLQESFLPRVRTALSRLQDSQVWWRPNDNSNSVGNIVLHMCGNLRQWIIAGVGGAEDTRTRPLEFSEKGPITKADLTARLEEAVAEATSVLRDLDRTRLLERRNIQVYEVSLLRAVFHAVEHFSYHTGQIIYVVKMLQDEDLKFYDL